MSSACDGRISYPIPGPAGDIFSSLPSSAAWTFGADAGARECTSTTPRGVDIRLFTQGAWQRMLEVEGFEPFGRKKMRHSVQSFRHLIVSEGRTRVDELVLRILALESVGRDARALLGDLAGTVESTFHSEVLRSLRDQVEVGTVLILKNVSALILFDHAGSLLPRVRNLRIHLSIQLSNIVRAFKGSSEVIHQENIPHSLMGWKKPLMDAYTSDNVPVQERNRRNISQREFMSNFSLQEIPSFGEPQDSWKKMARSVRRSPGACHSRIRKVRCFLCS